MRTSNRDCRRAVEHTETFTAHNVFAENRGKFYVVYSYGHHFPMWAYDREGNQWYGNMDKYSVSTSRQQSQSRPFTSGMMIMMHTQELQDLILSRVTA